MKRILVIDDEKDIVEAIEYNLKKEGYKVNKAFDGRQGLKSAKENIFDLIILDLMLPGISGLDVCKSLKKDPKTSIIPVIMLTAKDGEVDKIVGFGLGADDYITKPFSLRELLARVRAVLKRTSSQAEATVPRLKFADLEIDADQHQVKVRDKLIDLTAKEFALLKYLAENKERFFSREKLLDTIWGIDVAIETRTVDVHIRRIREKLGKASKHIQTLHGVGYKFRENV
jgi:phosphate regulon transcriptional regulator PhoB